MNANAGEEGAARHGGSSFSEFQIPLGELAGGEGGGGGGGGGGVHESWRIADELEREEERERARCKAAEEEKATTEEESEDSEADEHKTEEDKTVEGEKGKATESGHKVKGPKGTKDAADGQRAEGGASHGTLRHDCSLKGCLVPVEREGEGKRGRERERGMDRERDLETAISKKGGGAGEARCSGLLPGRVCVGRTSVPTRSSRYSEECGCVWMCVWGCVCSWVWVCVRAYVSVCVYACMYACVWFSHLCKGTNIVSVYNSRRS